MGVALFVQLAKTATIQTDLNWRGESTGAFQQVTAFQHGIENFYDPNGKGWWKKYGMVNMHPAVLRRLSDHEVCLTLAVLPCLDHIFHKCGSIKQAGVLACLDHRPHQCGRVVQAGAVTCLDHTGLAVTSWTPSEVLASSVSLKRQTAACALAVPPSPLQPPLHVWAVTQCCKSACV